MTPSNQIFDSLDIAINEYLSDSDISPEDFFGDLYNCVKSNYDYYQENALKCKSILDKIPNLNKEKNSKYYYDCNKSSKVTKKDWDDFWDQL